VTPERLAELQRQRSLVKEHLAWLEREIATAAGEPARSVEPAVASLPLTTPTSSLDSYQPDPVAAATQARRGCLAYAALVLFLSALGLTAIYFFRYRDHPLLFAGPHENTAAPTPASGHK